MEKLSYNHEYRVMISPDAGFDSIPVTPCFTMGRPNEITSIANGRSLYFYEVQRPGGDSTWYVFSLVDIEQTIRRAATIVGFAKARDCIEFVFVPEACIEYLVKTRKKTNRRARRTITGTRPLSKKTSLINKPGQTATAGNIAIAPPTSGVQLVPFRKIVKK